MDTVAKHYDFLIDENHDPVYDPKPLREYMDKWDGQTFIDQMDLDKSKSVLEIGVGTGRLAVRVVPLCGEFVGIDLSPKTLKRAGENLAEFPNVTLLCGDFLTYEFDRIFDVVYSSLTFMHIKEKQAAIEKVARLLRHGGRFLLSIDKNQSEVIDFGARKIQIYPDDPAEIKKHLQTAGLVIKEIYETEFAIVFVAKND